MARRIRYAARTNCAVVIACVVVGWMSAIACSHAADVPRKLEVVEPGDVGMDIATLTRIDDVVAEGLRDRKLPGCVICIGRRGKIAWLRAYGHRQTEPTPLLMTTDTIFDLASITKPVATATSVMILFERGQLELDQPVAHYLPEFAQNGKEAITVEQLLTHVSGLTADNALADYQDGVEKAWERIHALAPRNEPGTKFTYSDVGFLVLGQLVQRVAGKSVHEFSRDQIFEPLGMRECGYLPGDELRARAAPTEMRDGRWLQGEVHDPRARLLGGVAGHAGLFSTATDLAIYAQMMLDRGQHDGRRILKAETVARMTQAHRVSSGQRGLGWDKRTGYSINRGEGMTESAFGHGGFTGTVLWIDPGLDLFVIFLSNRVHPHGQGLVNPLAGRVGTIAVESVR